MDFKYEYYQNSEYKVYLVSIAETIWVSYLKGNLKNLSESVQKFDEMCKFFYQDKIFKDLNYETIKEDLMLAVDEDLAKKGAYDRTY